MFSTKKRILDASIRLFNENGVDAVRLQQIAEEVGISVGNLAYHYKNKDAIIESAYEQLFGEFNEVFRLYLSQPDMTDFDNQIAGYYHFFLKNQFHLSEFLKSNSNYASPIYQQWQNCIGKMMVQLKSRLNFLIMRGDLIANVEDNFYDLIAEQCWMSLVFSIPKQNIFTGKEISLTSYKKSIWYILKPYFTEQGLHEFNNMILPQFIWD